MRTTLIAALVAAAVPASAAAHDGGSIKHKNQFLRERVVDIAGERAPGRDIVTYGVRNGKPATAGRIRSYFGTMRRMIAPRPQPVARVRTPTVLRPAQGVPVPVTPTAPAAAPAPVAGGPERFAQCESGGDWNAVNPTSGAFGRYQLMPQHYNGGMCSDLGRDPSGQTACANRVFEAQGSGAWSQCGG